MSEKTVLSLKIILDEDGETVRLESSCTKSAPLQAVSYPLMILVDKMIDALVKNPDATLKDLAFMGEKEAPDA